MPPTAAESVVRTYRDMHSRILRLAEQLSDEQLIWRPQPGALPIAFHLWHAARWADHLQASIAGMTPELARRLGPGEQAWERGGYAARWGFAGAGLGEQATGMHMDESAAVRLAWPPAPELLAYLRAAFAAAERAIAAVDDEQFAALEQPQPLTAGIWAEGSTVGDAILAHVTHTNRHLGMVECLRGLQGGSGTATV
jgi:hypothetical protein